MRIVVSGAAGFVGRTVAARLVGAGHRVIALLRRIPAHPPLPPEVEIFECGDLSAFAGWTAVLKRADALVHLAAIAHRSVRDEDLLKRVNIDVTENAARAAAAAGARFVFLSSVKVLGEETAGDPFRAGDAPAPQDAYARAKAAAERIIAEVTGLDWTVFRPPLVYGPGVKANFLALMTAVARGVPLPLGTVENSRSLLFVGNLADAVARCLEVPHPGGRAYLLSDGAPVSSPGLCRAIGDALGRRARLLPFPSSTLDWIPAMRSLTRSLEVDDSAIRSELDWHPPYTFEQGLRATAEWYLAQGR